VPRSRAPSERCRTTVVNCRPGGTTSAERWRSRPKAIAHTRATTSMQRGPSVRPWAGRWLGRAGVSRSTRIGYKHILSHGERVHDHRHC
jgi:hypothetical protein